MTTVEVTKITETSAISGGNIISNNATIIAAGVCWSTDPVPTIADGKTIDLIKRSGFESQITRLTPGTNYFLRAYAVYTKGTSYGNVYHTAIIGTQEWMVENLKATSYNDGGSAVGSHHNDASYNGAVNTWGEAKSGALCPNGWAVPSYDSWQTLADYRGDDMRDKITETGTAHGPSPNTKATNESGFTALPQKNNTAYAFWWTSTGYSQFSASGTGHAFELWVPYGALFVGVWYSVPAENSVRCIKK